ncbi:hypothetical protein [Banggai cardinalfish iridovirus]|uniref:Uncharacterized protein n=1 Tax=Banggai cardinalfish iridovirus TaxID=565290 RepID=A0A6M3QWR9_ISKNV|nr:hypothetical protein [Banggai cardinalfish iridovirus]
MAGPGHRPCHYFFVVSWKKMYSLLEIGDVLAVADGTAVQLMHDRNPEYSITLAQSAEGCVHVQAVSANSERVRRCMVVAGQIYGSRLVARIRHLHHTMAADGFVNFQPPDRVGFCPSYFNAPHARVVMQNVSTLIYNDGGPDDEQTAAQVYISHGQLYRLLELALSDVQLSGAMHVLMFHDNRYEIVACIDKSSDTDVPTNMASCFAYTINGRRQATTNQPGVMAHIYVDDDGVQVATPNGVATQVTWADLDNMDSLQFTAYYSPGLYGFPVAPNTIMAATGALATALTIRTGTDAARVALITEGRERAVGADAAVYDVPTPTRTTYVVPQQGRGGARVPGEVENLTYDVPTPTGPTYVVPHDIMEQGGNIPSPGELENLTYDVATPAASPTTPYVLPSDIMPYAVSTPLRAGDASPYAVSSLEFVADTPPQPPASYTPRTPAPPYSPPAIPQMHRDDDMTDILRNTMSARRAAMHMDDDDA